MVAQTAPQVDLSLNLRLAFSAQSPYVDLLDGKLLPAARISHLEHVGKAAFSELTLYQKRPVLEAEEFLHLLLLFLLDVLLQLVLERIETVVEKVA